ncbi:MAG: 4Fe-4S binding protein [Deltaproteobacteria bacterium]|nr:4Fe-4S binding protein [Deltaproteobacteria bacterium]
MRRRRRGGRTYAGLTSLPILGRLAVPLSSPPLSYGAPSSPIAQINTNLCIGCGRCAVACPVQAISLSADAKPVVNAARCQGCGVCAAQCPVHAISLVAPALSQK